jgi:glycosyltransferase involved in cell wall biosynthesis
MNDDPCKLNIQTDLQREEKFKTHWEKIRFRVLPRESRRGRVARAFYHTARNIIQQARNRPVRRLILRALRWAVAHCPRRVIYFLYRRRWMYVGILPERIKEYLRVIFSKNGPNIALRKELDRFLLTELAGNSSGRLFLIFCATEFRESEGQRPTRFARELAKRGIPVIFVYWRWDVLGAVLKSGFPHVFCFPIDEFLTYYETLLTDARLSPLDRVLMMEFPHPGLLEIANYANACGWKTVYDVLDDWEEFHKEGQAIWYDGDVEAYMLHNTDITTVICENLLRKMRTLGAERAHLLPNGFEDWSDAGRKPPPKPRKGRITIGYFGHLTNSWFDWPLVERIARRRPDWVFQIIGYGLDRRVESNGNVSFLGRVEHRDLPAYAQNWDVAMIPFRPSKLSLSVDPIKIYEYISLGLPTVLTGMPHLASYPGVIVADSDEEFEAAVQQAAGRRLDEATIKAFLDSNRWSNRIDDLLKILARPDQRSAVSLALAKDEAPPESAAA